MTTHKLEILLFLLQTNNPQSCSLNADPHSWSANSMDGFTWTKCCYLPGHSQMHCLHNKPKEFNSAWNSGLVVELSASSSWFWSASQALNLWKSSEEHNSVILNKGSWNDIKWTKIGAAIVDGYANAWFST